MFKTRYKIISFFLIMSIVMSFATITVNAGTIGSNGSHGSGGNGTGSDDRYLNNCFIDWSKVSSPSAHDIKNIKGVNNPSSISWSTWISTVTDGGETINLQKISPNIAKWSAVIKYTGSVKYYDDKHYLWYSRQSQPWKFFRWKWWYKYFDDPDEVAEDMDTWEFKGLTNPLKDSKGHDVPTNVLLNGNKSIWMNGLDIPDPDLVKSAKTDGYGYNMNFHMWKKPDQKKVGDGDKLDIVWVNKNAMETPKSETKTVLIKTIGAEVDYNHTAASAAWLWDHCPTSRTYHGKSADGQYTYSKTVQGWHVILTHRWKEQGGVKVPGSDSYTKGSINALAGRKFTYTVNAPSVDVERFNALDLNRNGNALSSDVAADFGYTPASGKNLKADVDNGLNITDGTALPALDSNNVVPFQLTFNNNQFGIPTAAQGGYDIETNSSGISPVKDADGNYDIATSFAEGSTEQQLSTWKDEALVQTKPILYPTGETFAGLSTVSNKTHYWTGSNLQLQAFTNKPNSSLVYNGNEYTYKQGSSATRVPISAESSATGSSPQVETIKFRSIKSGDYKLSNNASKDWWTVSYQGGKLYTYGVEFQGTIVAGHGINPPTLVGHDFYVATASTSTVQPILKGNFNVKSVGGDI